MTRHRRRGAARLLVASLAWLLAVAGLLGSADRSVAAPTPGPTDATQAQTDAGDAAGSVADLQARIGRTARSVAVADRAAAAAQQRFDRQVALERAAADGLRRATEDARRTGSAYEQAHAAFVEIITAQYEGGAGGATLGRLLTAGDPGELLTMQADGALVEQYVSGVLERNRTALAADDQARRRRAAALATQHEVSTGLRAGRDRARQAAARAAAALGDLRKELLAARVTQERADAVLSQFLGGWSLADPARAAALNRYYVDLVQRAAGPDGADLGGRSAAERGSQAALRALSQIGRPYAWAGGNGSGPTAGLCTAGDAANDCHVVGYDCSGLAMYAWAPDLPLPHLASAQYSAGRVHPAVTDLLPGDLVFWSTDGRVDGIHHVAIYVGEGNVVQAPQSGDIVRVTPLGSVDSGYFGATRPLN